MRTELKAMQAQFDTTTIYVTHDYAEALSLGDRIAIIDQGRIVQVGNGDEIYYTPANEFVARLVGEPEITILTAQLRIMAGKMHAVLKAGGKEYPYEIPADAAAKLDSTLKNGAVRVGIRGINLDYQFEPVDGFIPGVVYNLEPIGNKSILTIVADGQTFQSLAPNTLSVKLDTPAYIRPDPGNMLFFDPDSGDYLTRHDEARLIGRE
jgi:ABC-type sugar transport systems, ATPase components